MLLTIPKFEDPAHFWNRKRQSLSKQPVPSSSDVKIAGELFRSDLLDSLTLNRGLPASYASEKSLLLILVSRCLDGTFGLGEIIRHHHRMNLNACIKSEKPRLGNRGDL